MEKTKVKVRILFLCNANSCRSQMAEGFAKVAAPEDVEVFSAGADSTIGTLNPLAVKVMAEVGIDISAHFSKTIVDLPRREFDLVISLCWQAEKSCPVMSGAPTIINWGLAEPSELPADDDGQQLQNFREMRDKIGQLVEDLFSRGYLKGILQTRNLNTALMDGLAEGILAHDANRRIFHFNRAAEEITGFKRQEVINRDCHDIFPEGFCGSHCSFCDGDQQGLNTGCADQGRLGYPVQLTDRSGEMHELEVSVTRVNLDGNGKMGVLAVFRDLTREHRMARRLGEVEQFAGIIGKDPKMLAVYDLIKELASSAVPVLVQGESGTGKELVAAAVHNEGPRAKKLFVPVNCGALPEGLLESELFGHVRGAFTGAVKDKKGRFELADGGTIFLDEVADLSPPMQVKLLRVLQEGTFERVGGERTIRVDSRVISATNKDLLAEVEAGRFREDLYYRLCVVSIGLPALRARRTDIPLLAQHLLARAIRLNEGQSRSLSQVAIEAMIDYSWPGNVRELQNAIQYSLVKCPRGVIELRHLPATLAGTGRTAQINLKGKRGRKPTLTKSAALQAIAKAEGNKSLAAKSLGVGRATLYRVLAGR
jgi:sigma-54 dependent transcriptional regulator, acetoin dehydrogenase operon transcriptional activator AcoR